MMSAVKTKLSFWQPSSSLRRANESKEEAMSRTLVVEDDPTVRDVVEYARSKERLQAIGVGDGEEALEHLRGSLRPGGARPDAARAGSSYSVCREIRGPGAKLPRRAFVNAPSKHLVE